MNVIYINKQILGISVVVIIVTFLIQAADFILGLCGSGINVL
jgi:hypothetical protein